jgi:hypothetical protein
MMEVVFEQNERGQWDPSPIAFQNVYDEGDRLEKVQGCEVCPRNCCGTCKLLVGNDCRCHLMNEGADKPFLCCVIPTPVSKMDCALVWKFVKGPNTGKFRFKCDDQKVFRNEWELQI